METYLTLLEKADGEYTEKRSRFLATVLPCSTEEQANKILAEYRSAHWEARHCVYAYLLRDGTVRFSDDGEPHGTAGKPILEILRHSGLSDVMAVVVRYFGGILLGTGGLCRAYSAAAKDAVEAAQFVEMRPSVVYSLCCSYADHPRLLTEISAVGGTVKQSDFTENVLLTVAVGHENALSFEERIRETFGARITPKAERKEYAPFFLKK